MSIVDYVSGVGRANGTNGSAKHRPLHRLAAVRRLQGMSRRTLARKLNMEIADIRRQEEETTDLQLSTLYLWQEALEVPVGELLVESNDALAEPLLKRAQLVRLMKTALAIHEQANSDAMRLMAQTMIDQLVEVMPELRGVSAWHAVGKRRRLDELGVAAERTLSDDVFLDLTD